MKKGIFIVILFCLGLHAHAQVPGYDITFNQIFDNREYFSDYAYPQTIFGSRIDASLRFELDTLHRFSTGLSYLYENGSSVLAISPQPILNYQYSGEHLKMAFGSFSRKEHVALPLIFLTDTLNYYRSNIEGASITYENQWSQVNAFIDWTGRVSDDARETFLVGLNSKIELGSIYLNPIMLMYHNARSSSPLDSVNLQDNGILSLLIGYDKQKDAGLFYFTMNSGIVASYNRFRPNDLEWGRGVLTNIKMRYTIFGLNGVYYYGTPIHFEYGDPFYRAGNYGRVDFFIDPFANPKIESKIGWNIHAVPGEGIHHSQQILISIAF